MLRYALLALLPAVLLAVQVTKVRERGQSLRMPANLRLINKRQIGNNQVSHMEQVVQGLEVFGYGLTVQHISANAARGVKPMTIMNGNMVQGVDNIITAQDAAAMHAEASAMFERVRGQVSKRETLRKATGLTNLANDATPIIHVDEETKQAVPAFLVRFVDETAKEPSHPHVIVSREGKILEQFEGLRRVAPDASQLPAPVSQNGATKVNQHPGLQNAQASGPGGNTKIGRDDYENELPVTQRGNTCFFDGDDVRTIDLENSFSNSKTTPFSFECFVNNNREVNGAFSPMNDAHFYGNEVFRHYSELYNTAPLERSPLLLKVHYRRGYENAFFDGSSMTFGDGARTFFPLTCLDVVAHEVAHGVTDQSSGLIYARESGGLNEAFSDMAGKAVERFVRGSEGANFIIGFDINKGLPFPGLRCMDDPPCDRRSIDHISDYRNGLDVHFSSGLFNKVYFQIASAPQHINDHKDAYDLFHTANTQYWGRNTGFLTGAELTLQAAADLKAGVHLPQNNYDHLSLDVIKAAFQTIGISCRDLSPNTFDCVEA